MNTEDWLKELCLEALSVAHDTIVTLGEAGSERATEREDTDITTSADLLVSERLIEHFRRNEVPAVILSEESGRVPLVKKPKYAIALDEIDGTNNYFRGKELLPYCTAVTFFDSAQPTYHDALIACVIEHGSSYIWHAVKHRGCYLNKQRVVTSGKNIADRETLVIIDHYASGSGIGKLTGIHTKCWVKDFGSAALHLAGVSSGLFDAYVSSSQKAHELGAGCLLIGEAGGHIADKSGKQLDERPFDFDSTYDIVAASSKKLYDSIVKDI
jgi:myo-inositol-1(or 4)-monophosphatase